MRNIYLVLAVIGAIVPYAFFIQHFAANGVSLPVFIADAFANGSAGGFTADVLISSTVFWIYMFRDKGGPNPTGFIGLNLFIGLSCALPAYLWWRSRVADHR